MDNWPLRDDGAAAWLLVMCCGAASAAAAVVTGESRVGWVIFGLLMFTGWRLWIPVRYHLGPRGIEQYVLGRRSCIPWTEIGRYVPRKRGVVLYSLRDNGPLSILSAYYLRWAKRRDEILAVVDYYLRMRQMGGSSVISASRSGSSFTVGQRPASGSSIQGP